MQMHPGGFIDRSKRRTKFLYTTNNTIILEYYTYINVYVWGTGFINVWYLRFIIFKEVGLFLYSLLFSGRLFNYSNQKKENDKPNWIRKKENAYTHRDRIIGKDNVVTKGIVENL